MVFLESLAECLASPTEPGSFHEIGSLRPGERAVIVEVRAEQASAKRLADMGFVRGSGVEMLRRGKPCLVRIGSTCVGLGRGHQEQLLVRRIDPRLNDQPL